MRGAMLVFIASLAAAPALAQPTALSKVVDYEPAISADGTRLAFISNRDGRMKLHTMSAAGDQIKRLTDDAGVDDSPAWSPDGTKLAFVSEVDGNSDIYVVDADGSGRVRLTSHKGADIHPNWSPDGKRILFNSLRDPADSNRIDLFEVKADGTGERALAPAINGSYASWSPDGRIILTRMMFGDQSEIAPVDAAGKLVRRLTNNTAFDGWPSWAPDGRAVVFARERGDEADSADIVVITADGASERVVASEPGRKTNPRWSRDGTIIYSRRADQQVRLWRIPAPQ